MTTFVVYTLITSIQSIHVEVYKTMKLPLSILLNLTVVTLFCGSILLWKFLKCHNVKGCIAQPGVNAKWV